MTSTLKIQKEPLPQYAFSRKKQWYAVYTRSRFERKVAEDLIEYYKCEAWCPTHKVLSQWHDRKKWVEKPLFNSYIFVKADPLWIKSFVYQTSGAVFVVTFEGKPCVVPENQIENLRLLLNTSENFEVSSEVFGIGQEVEVRNGAMRGFKGTLISHKGSKKVMMRIEAINQTILVEIESKNLKKVTT